MVTVGNQVIFARGFELIPASSICIESNSKCVHFSQKYQTGVDEVEEYAKHVRFSLMSITMWLVKFSFIRC